MYFARVTTAASLSQMGINTLLQGQPYKCPETVGNESRSIVASEETKEYITVHDEVSQTTCLTDRSA